MSPQRRIGARLAEMRYKGMLIAILLGWLLAGRSTIEQSGLRYRWVYISQNLAVDSNVQTVTGLMRRAKAAGYNGVVLADYKFQILDQMGDPYFRNVAAVKRAADELGLAIYPTVCPIGYSNGL